MDILDGEHRMLERLASRAVEVVDSLMGAPEGDLRRQVVLHLHEFLRLRAVLEHHTLRETTLVYPVLDEALTDDERRAMMSALRG